MDIIDPNVLENEFLNTGFVENEFLNTGVLENVFLNIGVLENVFVANEYLENVFLNSGFVTNEYLDKLNSFVTIAISKRFSICSIQIKMLITYNNYKVYNTINTLFI